MNTILFAMPRSMTLFNNESGLQLMLSLNARASKLSSRCHCAQRMIVMCSANRKAVVQEFEVASNHVGAELNSGIRYAHRIGVIISPCRLEDMSFRTVEMSSSSSFVDCRMSMTLTPICLSLATAWGSIVNPMRNDSILEVSIPFGQGVHLSHEQCRISKRNIGHVAMLTKIIQIKGPRRAWTSSRPRECPISSMRQCNLRPKRNR